MLEVRLLGQFEVLRDGARLAIPTRNAQTLFAYLVLNAGKAYRRERLAGLLWPDSGEDSARSNLRHELWRLRKALETEGETYFQVDDLTIAFSPSGEYFLDAQRLESVPVEGSQPETLMEALDVYQGELLPGFYAEWVLVERERLFALFEARVTRLLELLKGEGRWPEVVEWAMRWISFGDWPEPAYRALITAYASNGHLSKAAATYERYAQALQKELGVKPSEQTQSLYKRIKTGWKAASTAKVVGADRTAHESSEQPLPLSKVRRSNLPRLMTSFIGREKEIQQVERLISKNRLVTVTGSGGVGKTRLAIQTAGTLAPRFRDGVCWVELAALFLIPPIKKQAAIQSGGEYLSGVGEGELGGVDLVAQAVAKTLRVPQVPGQSLLDGVFEHLQSKQLLLVLDNCEHLIEACAQLVERLLLDCPEVSILTTSREALGVPSERAWYLPSLSLPAKDSFSDVENLLESEAVNLFIERTADVIPDFQPSTTQLHTIAQICLWLDGIPLAIELAAARMKLLSVQEIAARLDRRFNLLTGGRRAALPRHQTLWAAIEWSFDLLTEAERVLFRRLAVFPGSFTLEAAEAVCAGETVQGEDVLTLLGRLVDKSLLMVEPAVPELYLTTRYRFLDTIRSFGLLKLDAAEEIPSLHDRHAAYYGRLIESIEPQLVLQYQGIWYRLLQVESDNIRAAIEWCAESDQAENALRIAGALLWFWWSHGHGLLSEGLDLVLKTLSLPSAAQFPLLRARALKTAGFLQWSLGDIASARRSLEEVLLIVKSLQDESSQAWSLQILGLVLTSEGEYDQADEALRNGLAIAKKLGDLNIGGFALAFRGDIHLHTGDRLKAKRVYEESVDMLRVTGNKLNLAYPLRRLGYLFLERNEIELARKNFRESLDLNLEGGDRRAVAACLTSIAFLAFHLDKPVAAARLLGAVESQLESLSFNLLYLDQIELGRLSSKLLDELGESTFSDAISSGWELDEENLNGLVEEIFGKSQ